jgi:formyl-CoA transferase
MRTREIFCEIDHAVRGSVTIPGWSVKMSDSYVRVTSSPILGTDNMTIYGDWLAFRRATSKS